MTLEDQARIQDWRRRLGCLSRDPCAYDHTCVNHMVIGEVIETLAERARERDVLREYVEEMAGADCHQYDKFLNRKPCGTCDSCRARTALAAAKGKQC